MAQVLDLLLKFAVDQPRDANGEFASGGTGVVASKMTMTELNDVHSIDELKQAMKRPQFMDGRAHLVSVTFGHTTVYSYPSASKIPASSVGQAEAHFGGYFQNGEVKPFSHAKRMEYQRQGMRRD
jgi:hypothetical protein